LSGMGYAAYAVATFFAIRQQAEEFLLGEDAGPDNGFLPKLADRSKVNAAFLLTRPPDTRGNMNPDDQESMEMNFNRSMDPARPGALGNFRESMLVRIVENGGAGNSYQVLSVKDCTYKEGRYWVEMDVEITTPEIVVRVPFTVRSQDVAGHGRKWYVDWTKTPPGPVPEKGYIWLGTKRGEQLGRLRKEAQAFASKWAEDLKRGK